MDDIRISPHNLLALIEQVGVASPLSPAPALHAMCQSSSAPGRNDVILDIVTGPLMETLARPWALGALIYQGLGVRLDTSVYFPASKDTPPVQVTTETERMRLQNPPQVDAACALLAEKTGTMLTDPMSINWQLSAAEALTLMCILDAARKLALQRLLADQTTTDLPPIPTQAVTQILATPSQNMQWLNAQLRVSLNLAPPDGRSYQASLLGLAQRRLITISTDSLQLSEETHRIVTGLLIAEGHLVLRAMQIHQASKTLRGAEIRIAQGRTGAFLGWMAEQGTVQFFSAAAGAVINLAHKILLTPWQALESAPSQPTSGDIPQVGMRNPQNSPHDTERTTRRTP